MADDQSYLNFLEKANAPLTGYSNKSCAQASSQKLLKTMDEGQELPKPIKDVLGSDDAIYVTDADEPFEGVSLKFERPELPTAESFAALIDHPTPLSANISIQTIDEWDVRGAYCAIIESIVEASGVKEQEIKVYVVPRSDTKTEYWITALDKQNKRLLGAKALGVES